MFSTPWRRIAILVSTGVLSLDGHAQQIPGGSVNGPKTKIYLSETEGNSTIVSNGVTYTAEQAKSFDAPGTVIETKEKSHNAFVYSNGTALYMEPSTQLKIDRFAQARFQAPAPNQANPEVEPSASQSTVVVSRGAVGICTNQLAAGTSMIYSTPHATISIRRGRVSIETSADQTVVDLLEGEISVRAPGATDARQLRPGDRAIVRRGAGATVELAETPKDAMPLLDERTTIACNAKKTVFFDANDAADQQITPSPVVPLTLPANLTVSPDRLPGT